MLILSSGGGGRSRAFASNAGRQRNLAERTAVNTVIQGSAADLIKLAMIAIHRRLRREKLRGQDVAADPRRIDLRSSLRSKSTNLAQLVTEEMVGVHEAARSVEGGPEGRAELGRCRTVDI